MGCGASSRLQGKYEAVSSKSPGMLKDDENASKGPATKEDGPPAEDEALPKDKELPWLLSQASVEHCQPGSSLMCLITRKFGGFNSVWALLQFTSLGNGELNAVSNVLPNHTAKVKGRKFTSGLTGVTCEVADDGTIAISSMNCMRPVSCVELKDVDYNFENRQLRSCSQLGRVTSTYFSLETGLMKALESGAIRLLRGKYIEEQWAERQPLGRLQDLPEHALWSPDQATSMWADYGPAFLLALSYAWVTAEHPDPEMYHLERVARVISEYRATLPAFVAYFKANGDTGPTISKYPTDVGVFWDYASLPQRNAGQERTEKESHVFQEGIKQVNVIYGHARTTVLRCKALPTNIRRQYDDRGWPAFEVSVTDSKPAYGLKVFVFGSSFDPRTSSTGLDFFLAAVSGQNPPRTLEHFEEELRVRGERAAQRGERLFTNGSDNPFVVQKYFEVWSSLCLVERFSVDKCEWSASEIQSFCSLLPQLTQLKEISMSRVILGPLTSSFARSLSSSMLKLSMAGCGIDHDGAVALASAIRNMQSLECLRLQYNPLGNEGTIVIIESLPQSIQWLSLDGSSALHGAFEVLASSLPSLPNLHILFMTHNKPGAVGLDALANAIAGSALGTLNLFSCGLEASEIEMVRTSWTATGRSESGLDL